MAWVEAPYATLDQPPLRLPTARQAQWRDKPDEAPQAIVVLAGGSTADGAASRAPNRVSPQSLERVLHAHRVARLTKLPVLVSGGVTLGGGDPEAELMRRVLEADLATSVKWVEATSRDTAESARATARDAEARGHPAGPAGDPCLPHAARAAQLTRTPASRWCRRRIRSSAGRAASRG